jgi:hypothetical protein
MILLGNIGKVAVSKGDVQVNRENATLNVTSGMIIQQKDNFIVSANGKTQLKFNDGTVITLGKNSDFSVEEYLLDDTAPKAKFKLSKGVFSAITGKISKIAPSKFKLKVKSASIGIRGTIFSGVTTVDGAKVGCTQGAISVSLNNKDVNVDSGEMVIIDEKNGVISQPKPIDGDFLQNTNISENDLMNQIKEKIANTKFIGDNLKVDEEIVAEIVADIVKIQNAESRRELEDILNDALAASFQQALEGTYYKVTPPESFQATYSSSSYSGIQWGFFTKDQVSANTDISFEERLAAATPVQAWMRTAEGEAYTDLVTPQTTISSYIGYTDDTGFFAPHWEYNADGRQLGIYNGKVIAVSNYSPNDKDGLPTDYTLLSAIAADAVNETSLRVDYGNKSFHALIKFDIQDNKNQDTDTWYVYVVGTGEAHVTPTGLKEVAYIAADGSEVLSSAEFTFRYLGENTEQIVGTFNLYNGNSSVTYGNMAFNNIELIELKPLQIGSNESFEWGYWADTSKEYDDVLDANPNGGWMKPKSDLAQTDPNYITSLVGGSSQLSYTGDIVGTVYNNVQNTTELMKSGVASFDFDFQSNTYGGNLQFDTQSHNWNLDVNNIEIPSGTSGFMSSSFSAAGTHNAGTPVYGELNGKFYGSTAQNVAGGFEIMSYDSNDKSVKTAIGAFNGK